MRRARALAAHVLVLYLARRTMLAQQVIDVDGVPIPLPVAIPQHGAPTHIPRFGDRYTWDDVKNFVSGGIHAAWDALTGAAGLSLDVVRTMILAAINEAQTAWSSFVNLAIDATYTVNRDLSATISALTGYTLSEISLLIDEMDYIGAVVHLVTGTLVPSILDELHGLERAVVNGIEGAVSGVESWAIDNIYNPLDEAIREVESRVDRIVVGTAADVMDWTRSLLDTEKLERLAALGLVTAAIAELWDWVNDCGEPTCELVGPRANLGKVLQALEGLLTILAGVELARLTEADLERMARVLAGIGTGGARGLLEGFVEGGETVGTAAADVLGDMGGAAREVLHELGVPV